MSTTAVAPSSGVRFYDPTTATFLTRDPANAVTRSAYGYVYGNPLNHVDRNGLWPWDGICVQGVNCGEGATDFIQDNAVTQGIADVSAGVLNGITLGHADVFIDEDKARWNSNWTRAGNVVGVALDVPILIPQSAGLVGIEATGAAGSLTFGSRMATGAYGLGFSGLGAYDFVQAQELCQSSPGTPECANAQRMAGGQVIAGGLAGLIPGAGGFLTLGFGAYDCWTDMSNE